MPIPIHPNSIGRRESPHSHSLDLTFDMLSQMIGNHSSLLTKEAEFADNDAEAVFSLWENSTIIRDASNIEDRLYRIPNSVSQTTITRLKTKGLLYGEKDQIRFTNHAAKIIKMMVLAEGNAFGKHSVKKPYSVILAESKTPKRKSNLALAQELQRPDDVGTNAEEIPYPTDDDALDPRKKASFLFIFKEAAPLVEDTADAEMINRLAHPEALTDDEILGVAGLLSFELLHLASEKKDAVASELFGKLYRLIG